ncbi:Ankyrin repeat and sterile alpha motif domain-containing protein 1B (Amyloid-beta protein intracellular domain-associated protein 1) (AIDA-1) (E2A-PBX1-associated protein) (EB-1) [Durusdinium trenchii]|uniref:Ankyrin repeat and sterile alpha motif domain-containing protein 1B (Amyloid-beta protein intracellular domain-associated protein 1) (AIDA-1) (E2A-PBX1-associated protein) (EB-1) n=1 Tax=Durusdinium trenchii TaxID=1381693 RepID=A0ABP0QF68_9DINO
MDDLLRDELLPALALLLRPVDLWSLRPLRRQAAFAVLCPSMLPRLRGFWAAKPENVSEVLRKGPQPSAALLRYVGEQLLIGCHPFVPNELGQTALTWASEYGLEEVLALLLGMAFDQPAHVQQVESNGWYPLFRAAWTGRAACARLLLKAAAHVEGPICRSRYSPLMCAARWGHREVVEALLEASADVKRRNDFGEAGHGRTRSDKVEKSPVRSVLAPSCDARSP